MKMGRFEKITSHIINSTKHFFMLLFMTFIKQGIVGVEEMAPRLRALAALAKHPSSISCIHMVAYNQL